MFYIMYGADDYSINEELLKIKSGLGDPDMLSVNTSVVDGRGLTVAQLIEMSNCIPFLHSVRLVIVKGLLERFEKGSVNSNGNAKTKARSKKDIGEWENISDHIATIPDTTVLVLIDSEVTAKNTLFKQLSPLATVKVFPKARGKDIYYWITKRIASQGGSITPKAVNMLTESIGGDLWNMSGEIEKLLIYTAGRTIDENDVRQLTNYSQAANIFLLVDAIIERRRSDAHRMFHKLLSEGVSVPYIITMITRQLRLIVISKDLKGKVSQSGIQNKLGISSDYAMKKVLTQGEKYTVEQLKDSYRKILEADVAIKTGKYESDLAIDLLVVELCS